MTDGLHVNPTSSKPVRRFAITTIPDSLPIPWRGRQLRVRPDDPRIGPYSPTGQRQLLDAKEVCHFRGPDDVDEPERGQEDEGEQRQPQRRSK
jgi:hypothetical protein